MKITLFGLVLLMSTCHLQGKCTHTFASTTLDYEIQLTLTPRLICTAGRAAEVEVDWKVEASGTEVPGDPLDILRVNLTCASPPFTINVPDQIGEGTVRSDRRTMDCAGQTLTSMGCDEMLVTIRGIGIDFQTITCATVLPVHLLEFDVKHHGISLVATWLTGYEFSSAKFAVEASNDMSKWEGITSVPSSHPFGR